MNRFVSGFTLRTPDQLDEWMNDLRLHLERAEEYATRGYWPMNDTACDKFGVVVRSRVVVARLAALVRFASAIGSDALSEPIFFQGCSVRLRAVHPLSFEPSSCLDASLYAGGHSTC